MLSSTRTKPLQLTLSAHQQIPTDTSCNATASTIKRPQFARVSLLNNPVRTIPESEVKRLFDIRRKYVSKVNEREDNREIELFEARQEGRPTPPPPPEIPIPSGLNIDMIRAYEPPSAGRMYGPYVPATKRASSVAQTRKHMVHVCPACNPSEDETENYLKPKRRNGTSHWQVLDEPEIPAHPPTTFTLTQKTHPFYLAAHRSSNGIALVQDDLLEMRERKQMALEKEIKRMVEKEKTQRRKAVHAQSLVSRESLRNRQIPRQELSMRSGQMEALSKIAEIRQKKLDAMLEPEAERPVSPGEQEAMARMSAFDDEMWKESRHHKNDVLLMGQQSMDRMSTLKLSSPPKVML